MRRSYTAAAMKGKRSRDIGEGGEGLTRHALHLAGFTRIRRVHTPWKILRNSSGKIVDAVPVEAVEGDFRAVDPKTGKSVLVETKTSTGDRIPWSSLEECQVEALDGHYKAGAIALLSIVLDDKAVLLPWPIEGFGPGCSIKVMRGQLFLSGTPRKETTIVSSRNDLPKKESRRTLKSNAGVRTGEQAMKNIPGGAPRPERSDDRDGFSPDKGAPGTVSES